MELVPWHDFSGFLLFFLFVFLTRHLRNLFSDFKTCLTCTSTPSGNIHHGSSMHWLVETTQIILDSVMLQLSCTSLKLISSLIYKAVQPAIVRVGAFLNNLSRFSLVHIW